jgi:hypothetical protein
VVSVLTPAFYSVQLAGDGGWQAPSDADAGADADARTGLLVQR